MPFTPPVGAAENTLRERDYNPITEVFCACEEDLGGIVG